MPKPIKPDRKYTPEIEAMKARFAARAAMDESISANAVNSILLVGTRYDSDELGRPDTIYLKQFLRTCLDIGLPVSPNLSIQECSIESGEDFLEMETGVHSFDAVLFCFIYHNTAEFRLNWQQALLDHSQSQWAYCRGAWIDAVKGVGAKLVGNVFGEGNELKTGLLRKPPYRLIADTPVADTYKRLHLLGGQDWSPMMDKPVISPHVRSHMMFAEGQEPLPSIARCKEMGGLKFFEPGGAA